MLAYSRTLRPLSLSLALVWSVSAAAQTVTPTGGAEPEKPAGSKPAKEKSAKERIDEARRAYQAGEAAYQAGDYKSAASNFKDAESLLPTPQATFWLAMALDKDGQVPEAIAHFKALLSDPNVSKIGDEKLELAKSALDRLQKTPGVIHFATQPPGASVAVDGSPHEGKTPLDLELPPGKHKLTFSIKGYDPVDVELDVPPGSKGDQKLELQKSAEKAAPAAPAPAPAPVAPAPPAPAKPQSRTGAYIVLGAAGAGLVTGAVFGVLALSAKKKFNDEPTTAHADAVDRDAMITDISLGAALTLGLASVVMFTSSSGPAADKGGSSARSRLLVAPYAGSHGGGAAARWSF